MQVERFTVGLQLAYKLMQSVEVAEEAGEEVEKGDKLTKRWIIHASFCSALVQQCNQVGVANCVACSVPDKTFIIPAAAAAAIPMPGSLSFKLIIKKKKLQLRQPRPALASSEFVSRRDCQWRLRFGDWWRRQLLLVLGEHCALSGQLPSALAPLWTLFPSVFLSCFVCHCCCCSCQLYSHVVVSRELQHGSFHLPICMQAMITASATLLSLSLVCAVFNPSLQLSLFMWPETRRLCLAWPALPDWRSAVGVCSVCACFIIMPSSYAPRSRYLPYTLYTIYHIAYIYLYVLLLSFMYSPSPLCIPTLSPAFSHAIVVSLAINLSLRIIKFVCSSNYAP